MWVVGNVGPKAVLDRVVGLNLRPESVQVGLLEGDDVVGPTAGVPKDLRHRITAPPYVVLHYRDGLWLVGVLIH